MNFILFNSVVYWQRKLKISSILVRRVTVNSVKDDILEIVEDSDENETSI